MTDRKRHDEQVLDDLAAYALDAVDDDERLAIEARLLADPVAADITSIFQAAASFYGAAHTTPSPPPPDLRGRVLAAATAGRAPRTVTPADVRDAHLLESDRFSTLIGLLTAEQLDQPLDAPEFSSWTVRDLVVHVTANETLLAQALGAPIAGTELDTDNEARTAAALDRHRASSFEAVVDEYDRARLAADQAAGLRAATELDDEIDWWGTPMRARDVLVLRSFETWTHADDIRRAIGTPAAPPSPPVLHRMSETAASFLPLTISTSGQDHTGQSILIDLTGAAPAQHHVWLGFDERELVGVRPAATVRMDVVAFCHGIGARQYLYEGGLPYEADGDLSLVDDLLSTIDALAVL